jgi:subtilisin-like proprotein convertase family protein
VALPANGCSTTGYVTVSSINVPECFTITLLTVGLNAAHTWRGDVSVILESPSGTAVNLLALDPENDGDGINVLFRDNTASPVGNTWDHDLSVPYYINTWSPAESLSTYNGAEAHGDWTLYVCDDVENDTGNVYMWELFFNTLPTGTGGAGGASGTGGGGGVSGGGATGLSGTACTTDADCQDPDNPCCFTLYCGPPPCL